MRIASPHTSCIPTSPLTFPYALAQSTPKGDFATVGHGAHADHDHRRGQQPSGFPHPDEIQQWPVAFIHSNFRVYNPLNPLKNDGIDYELPPNHWDQHPKSRRV